MAKPIKFGTDGWRGVIADDFTFERVALVAPIAAQILEKNYADSTKNSKTVIVGYDRRFMAEEFAQVAAEAVQNAGFDVLLTDTYAPTPAFSLAAFQKQALGAIVMTASHNPGKYLGLKVKGAFGGSVPPEITKQIEDLLTVEAEKDGVQRGKRESFNPWPSYCETLQKMVD
ncbi:MAG: phosphoglucomutase/phosphomannomutase family protein, partial [Okeania sp. SIO1H6]|nr:phosphoglucomutase/phosphomannomutase family protein [Okeania sp. SIO1H6]